MGKFSTLAIVAAVALVFGFLGSFAAVNVFAEDLRGPQGATGIPGLPGDDGTNGQDGATGPVGPPGKAGKAAKAPKAQTFDLGSDDCAGQPFSVVTDVRVARQHLEVDREQVCIKKAAAAGSTGR